ncbi:DNA glycosylase [Gloeopeniophorella convolvens]|nr:DNA glycosylase [Gloeopeniophorella convolvens]
MFHWSPIVALDTRSECVADDPWKLLVSVMLLNKTAGRIAVPVFWAVIQRWPTPDSLAHADPAQLENCIRCLGLQSIRAKRLISLSTAYMSSPEESEDSAHQWRKPPSQYPHHTQVSHLPGSGPYALDSYRIYCGGPDAWRGVVPADKELIRYLKWRWAADGMQWSPALGVTGPASETYLEQLIHELLMFEPYSPW